MFGQNPVRPQDLTAPHALRVKEIFFTIQGEGPWAGCPAVFIRMAGCNLQCYFCDTDFETDPEILTPAEVINMVRALQPHGLVVITGGEPLVQNITDLCLGLIERGYHVQIETAGTVWVPGLDKVPVDIVCSPKTGKVADGVAAKCQHWKYLIRQGEQDEYDGLPVVSTQRPGQHKRLYRPTHGTIYVQPMDEQDEEKNRQNMQAVVRIAKRYGYRVSLQTHKILGIE